MSESTFPFGAAGQTATQVADEPSPDRRRNAIALGALAAVVLGAGGYFLLSGGSEEETAFVQPAAAAAAPAARPTAPKAVGKLPVASKVRLGRSPFEVLYTPPKPVAAAPVAPVGDVADPSADAPVTGAGSAVGPGSGVLEAPFPAGASTGEGSGFAAPVPAPGSGTAGGTQTRPKLHVLTLTRVYGDGKDRTAVFSIDGKQQTAKVGGTFGPTAELLLLSLQTGPADDQWTAVLQVGDGDPFDVVTGTKVYVP